MHEHGRREEAPEGDAEAGEAPDGEREPAGARAEQVAELVRRRTHRHHGDPIPRRYLHAEGAGDH